MDQSCFEEVWAVDGVKRRCLDPYVFHSDDLFPSKARPVHDARDPGPLCNPSKTLLVQVGCQRHSSNEYTLILIFDVEMQFIFNRKSAVFSRFSANM
jgi:hypothetical protein